MLEIARNPKLRIRRDWDEVKIDFMEKAVKVKFTQLPELKKLLLETGDAELIAHSDEDSYWCDGGDGSGKNLLGMILMDLRDELREHEAKQTPRSK